MTEDELQLRFKEMLIAERLMGYRPGRVSKDYHGRNESIVLVPPDGRGSGYKYPPTGLIPPYYHVPKWSTDERMALQLMRWMQTHGSSLALNWGEDNDLWECSWISSGERFVGSSKDWKTALLLAVHQAAQEKATR